MSLSACSRSDGGMVRPSAFAVFALTTSSNLLGCSTGSSAGAAPLRDPVRVVGDASHDVVDIRPVGHKAASLQCQFREALSLGEEGR